MSKKIKLNITGFEIFLESLKSFSKVSEGAKLEFSNRGMEISGKNQVARAEIFTDAISSDEDFNVCLSELPTFIKLLETANKLHKDDISDINLTYEYPFLRIESKRIKTKLTTCKEEIIAFNLIPKMKTVLTPSLEFTTSNTLIKALNAHSFIFPNKEEAKIYLSEEPTMKKNTMFATLGNRLNDLTNSITMELGMINYGSLSGRNLILDYQRLDLMNIIPSETIKVQIMEKPIAMIKNRIDGKDGTHYDFTVYCSFKLDT